jgi:hypothetical protein
MSTVKPFLDFPPGRGGGPVAARTISHQTDLSAFPPASIQAHPTTGMLGPRWAAKLFCLSLKLFGLFLFFSEHKDSDDAPASVAVDCRPAWCSVGTW